MSKKEKVALISALIPAVAYVIVALINKPGVDSGPGNTPTPVVETPAAETSAAETQQPDDTLSPTRPTEKPSELREGDKIDIREITPLIGKDEDFWEDNPDSEDNLGNSNYSVDIYYRNGDEREITYPLDYKYSKITGDLALDCDSNDIDYKIWVEFYEGKKKVGETKKLTAGVRPIKFDINVKEVRDLRIIVNSTSDLFSYAYLLTNGFYLVK